MFARVVPVIRLRRDTATWSYRLSPSQICCPGSLVRVSFRGKSCLAVVWETVEKDDQAKESVTEVLSLQPLIKAPLRRFIEWLSSTGVCSLSSALYQWMPRALRGRILSPGALKLLREFNDWVPSSTAASQHAVLLPSHRPQSSQKLKERLGTAFQEMYADQSELEELSSWFKVAKGELLVGIGRERALYAPWSNLRKVTVIEPEDVSYYHEQIPYLNLTEAARYLSQVFRASYTVRTYLPLPAASLLYPGQVKSQNYTASIEIIDLGPEKIINSNLVERIQKTLTQKKQVLLLYNAKDRLSSGFKEGRIEQRLVAGLQTAARQLTQALGSAALPPSVILGTRSIFQHTYAKVGLTAVLSLDPLLESSILADQIHGWGDLGHLFSYPVTCLIQTHNLAHPLIQSLRENRWPEYCQKEILAAKNLNLPPFGQQIVCSYPFSEQKQEPVLEVFQQFQDIVQPPWQLGHPLLAPKQKKMYWHIFLSGPPAARLDGVVRKIAVGLQHPWKVQHNPWYLI